MTVARLRGLPYIGHTLFFVRDPFGYMERMALRHGDLVESHFAGKQVFLVNHPELVEHVLLKNRQNYRKDRFMERLRDLLGDGLLTSDGDLWKRHRRQMASAFNTRRVQGYAEPFVECAQTISAEWDQPQTIDLGHAMMRLTLEIAVTTLFGASSADDAARVGPAFEAVANYFGNGSMLFSTPIWVPTQRNRAYRSARAQLESVVGRIIDERRRDGGHGPDLLSALLQSRDDDGQTMSDRHLRDQIMTLLLAGHETTALTLTYTLHLLARHPEIEQAVVDEIRALGDRPITREDLAHLPLLGRVVTESLRLYPPAAIMGREAIGHDEMRGAAIRPDALMVTPQWVLHRSARYYPEPTAFRPDRWTPEFKAALPRFAYYPFGGGHRVCIGESFALLEANLVLATLLQSHRFRAVDPRPIETVLAITMRPKRPVHMYVERRDHDLERQRPRVRGDRRELGNRPSDGAGAGAGGCPHSHRQSKP